MESRLTQPSFLIAMPQLADANFKQSVILLIDHSASGALGVIVNRPSTVPVKSLVRGDLENIPAEVPAWSGGPVGVDRGAVLRYVPRVGPDMQDHVGHGVCLSTTEDAVLELMDFAKRRLLRGGASGDDEVEDDFLDTAPEQNWLYPYRFLVGHAGWGAKQLDRELRSGAWMQAPIDLNLLFDTPWPDMWSIAISQFGVNPMEIAAPHQPYLN